MVGLGEEVRARLRKASGVDIASQLYWVSLLLEVRNEDERCGAMSDTLVP